MTAMARMRHASEQIIAKFREVEVLLGQGLKMPEVCTRLDVTVRTCYRWRKENGNLQVNQARKLKELEKQNAHLKKLVADLCLDKPMLEEVTQGRLGAA